MFINKLSQLYKPRRILYYLDVTDEEIKELYNGKMPEKIAKYSGAFGTYDYPGLFFVRELEREVVGLEYRIDDPRVEYPDDLDHIILDEHFFYSVEFDEEIDVNIGFIRELFEKIAADDDAHRLFSDLKIASDPSVVSVFPDGRKIRILYEWRIEQDRAKYVIDNDFEQFDKAYLYRCSFNDFVTGHYNWNHLVSFLEIPMDADITDYAFVHFDIKEFRVLNEVYGHVAADNVLRKVVEALRKADFVYASGRCHNDNFAMIIKDMPEDETIRVLEDFFNGLSSLDEDPSYRIYYRCGVVPMQKAMLAGNRVADAGKMAQALGVSHNGTEIVVYTDKMHDDVSWSNFIKAYVETAIRNDEFRVYLQPKIDIKKNAIKGAEALVRWNYRGREFLPPSRFIPFFEKDGSIGKIDDIVLKKVCRALADWKREGKPLYPVSVNLSRNRLYEKDLIDHLAGIVDEYGVDHGLIDFELTESATYDNMDRMLSVLDELRTRGFKISMDDFGTGYSSLGLLTKMPIDTLKIDKSFVDNVATAMENEKDLIVIRHIIALARELGFVCLAEGAETKEQVEKLGELGCEIIQGYYFSKPIPMEDYEERYLSQFGS